VFNSALSAYAHTRPPLWKPARQLPRATCNALRRSLALSACERRAARTAWWLSGGCRRALARAARRGVRHRSVVFKLYGSYAAQVFGSFFVRVSACEGASLCALIAAREHVVLGHVEPLSVCEVIMGRGTGRGTFLLDSHAHRRSYRHHLILNSVRGEEGGGKGRACGIGEERAAGRWIKN
jgi:hypothetical protein